MGYADLHFNTGSRFLVIGGAGFIGSNLCVFILNMGYEVRCLDNFSTGKRENLVHLFAYPRYELIEGFIRNLDPCMGACA